MGDWSMITLVIPATPIPIRTSKVTAYAHDQPIKLKWLVHEGGPDAGQTPQALAATFQLLTWRMRRQGSGKDRRPV